MSDLTLGSGHGKTLTRTCKIWIIDVLTTPKNVWAYEQVIFVETKILWGIVRQCYYGVKKGYLINY